MGGMKPSTVHRPGDLTPSRLQFNAGYAAIPLKGAGTFRGFAIQVNAGQSFRLGRRSSLFFQGTFRIGSLESKARKSLSFLHFGMETGFDFSLAPRILSAMVFTGVGSNIFRSVALSPEKNLSLENAKAFAWTLGGGFSLARGLLSLTAAWQPNFGLKLEAKEGTTATRGYNPNAVYFNAGFDMARAIAFRHEENFAKPASFLKWLAGIQPGLIADSTYTYNFARPSDGKNGLRGFDNRWDRPMGNYLEGSLDRPAEASNPFGMRLDFGVGEDPRFAAPSDAFSGKYYTLQQLYLALRLPVGRGLTFRGPIFATPIGAEVLEGPLNNQISRSFQFNYGIPFRHMGVMADAPLNDKAALSVGLVHGWDNVFQLGREVSPAFLGSLNALWSRNFKTTFGAMVGKDQGRVRSLADVIAVLELKKAAFTANYDWGHDNAGEGASADNWHAFSLMARYDFNRYVGISLRGEVFGDLNGVRTGAKQVLGGLASTLHVQPWKWLRLRLEYRHDQSNRSTFPSRQAPSRRQDTLAAGIGLVF